MKRLVYLSIFLSLIPVSLIAAPGPLDSVGLGSGMDFGFNNSQLPQEILITNRILLKVKGEPITVMDLVKRMDLIFYRQYPNLVDEPVARFQFYSSSWKAILSSVIDNQLILADAEERKIEITDGDVREELEELFGPDVVLNIDSIGLTYEEVFKLLKEELTVRRMNAIMVRSKALNEVGPLAIRLEYEKYLQAHPSEEKWVYQVLSIRSEEMEKVDALSSSIAGVLAEQGMEGVRQFLEEKSLPNQLSLSEEYSRSEKEIAQAHREILSQLSEGQWSPPVMVSGRSSQQTTLRFFLLKKHQLLAAPSFDDLKNQLQAELTQKAVAIHQQKYLDKLREHYGMSPAYVNQLIPDDLQPFAMR